MSLLIAIIFFGLGSAAMIFAFKSAECADDHGFSWWWCPLVAFTLLSLFLLGQGVEFLLHYHLASNYSQIVSDSITLLTPAKCTRPFYPHW